MSATRHQGRYAPSPTGQLHLGNLRTALAAWLRARQLGARFTLRVDDLDPDRSRPELLAAQLDDLRAIGVDWDGDVVIQSERVAHYDAAIQRLHERDLAYPCFCSRADIRAAASAPHGESPDGAYPGTCAALAPSAAAQRLARGEQASMRVRSSGIRWHVDDLLLGRVETTLDDFVIRRKDGVAAYNLATVVDDAALGIDEVVRGADLATSAPRQAWLAQLLDIPAPTFAHVPLVLGPDGSRLAKRHGSVSRAQLAERGIDDDELRRLLLEALAPAIGEDGSFDLTTLPAHDARIDPDRAARGCSWELLLLPDDPSA